ncbi:hypothetical protein B296_00058213 [Ensete ventricosum]|uniref:Uncharacterized protein n=1 Tax=Ensete ventricosum TaxID=4639 RepID=A0A426WYW8_ENSVE|nr:hypothetical protein B296_00058213 [Ensete ventricosum]
MGGHLQTIASMGDNPCGLALATSSRPLSGVLCYSQLHLQPARPWVATPTRVLAMVDHPYKGSGRGLPPLQVP